MAYVELTPSAQQFLDALEPEERERIQSAVRELAETRREPGEGVLGIPGYVIGFEKSPPKLTVSWIQRPL